jgi:hypothetical protein
MFIHYQAPGYSVKPELKFIPGAFGWRQVVIGPQFTECDITFNEPGGEG